MASERIDNLERRVDRLEAGQRSLLDAPATLGGEPIYLDEKFPWEAKVLFGGIAFLVVLSLVMLVVGANAS